MHAKDLELLGRRLEAKYKKRNFDKSLDKAKEILLLCYESYPNSGEGARFSTSIYRALDTAVEIADYFNRMDADLGTEKHRPGQVYQWIRETAKKEFGILAELNLEESDPSLNSADLGDFIQMRIYQIRLAAAGHVNELYRESLYNDSYQRFEVLIKIGHALLAQVMEQISSKGRLNPVSARYLKTETEDMLSYLHFSAGKAARQKHDGAKAESHFKSASEYLLLSAQELARPQKKRKNGHHFLESAYYKLSRIGVVEVARAWNFLSLGFPKEAGASAELALNTLAANDKQNKMLANSILGIVKRIEAGIELEELELGIHKLEQSYDYFLKDTPTPRYAVRCLCELEIAYLIANQTKKALDALSDFAEYLKPSNKHASSFAKITQQSRWSEQLRLVKSRIARKAAISKDKNIELYLDTLNGILKGGRQSWPGKDPWKQALHLALEQAEIAEKCSDRTVQMDALICQGEALMALGNDTAAKKIFHRLLSKNEIDIVPSPGFPDDFRKFEDQLRKAKSEPHFIALPILYLAKIAVAHRQLGLAEFYLRQSKTLLRSEHVWLEELRCAIEEENKTVSDQGLFIDLRGASGLDEFEICFRTALAKKFNLLEEPVNKLMKQFHTDYYTIKRLRAKIRKEQEGTSLKKSKSKKVSRGESV